MNLAKFPRRGYVTEPTPLEALPNFSKALGADINIYIKRDDLLPGTAGGNKTRKLDFSMADAINQGADTIITCGAVQSNHCRLTLAWAVKEGLDCHLVLEERVKDSYNPEASGSPAAPTCSAKWKSSPKSCVPKAKSPILCPAALPTKSALSAM